MREKIEAALAEIKPMLNADGGDVEFVDFDEDTKVVKVRLKGACAGCPAAQMTLKNGVERVIKEKVPEVSSVEAVS